MILTFLLLFELIYVDYQVYEQIPKLYFLKRLKMQGYMDNLSSKILADLIVYYLGQNNLYFACAVTLLHRHTSTFIQRLRKLHKETTNA